MDDIADALMGIRGAKSRAQVKMRAEVEKAVISGPAASVRRLAGIERDLRAVGRIVGELDFVPSGDEITVEVTLAPSPDETA